jgi:hypothetical protein
MNILDFVVKNPGCTILIKRSYGYAIYEHCGEQERSDKICSLPFKRVGGVETLEEAVEDRSPVAELIDDNGNVHIHIKEKQ